MTTDATAEGDPTSVPDGRRDRVDSRLADISVAVSVTLVISLVVVADSSTGSHAEGIACACGFGALLLLRRRFPLVVLAATVLGIFAYYAADLPPIGMVLPAVGALYSTAEVRRTSWAVGGAAVLIAVSSFFRFGEIDPQAQPTGYGFVTELALAAASIALGAVVRLVAETRQQAERIASLTAAEETRAASARMQAERVRIARDLHDTIGHTLSVASLHTSVAAEAQDPTTAADALEHVRTATSEALSELRRTVRVLRGGADETSDAGPAETLGLASLPELLAAARTTGLSVRDDIDVAPSELPRPVDAAAFRIVQESMTNVLRHSSATEVRISIGLSGQDLVLIVRDDGVGRVSQAPAGTGIRGMRERVHLLGGELRAEAADTGFTVRARLPLDGGEGT